MLEGQDCILEIKHAAYAPYLLSLQKIPKAIELDTIRLEENVLEEVTVKLIDLSIKWIESYCFHLKISLSVQTLAMTS